MGNLSLAKMGYIVLVFCAATAVSSPGRTFATLQCFDGAEGQYRMSFCSTTPAVFSGG